MNTVHLSSHSQRKISGRRKVPGIHPSSPLFAEEGSKQSHHTNSHHRFTTPSPIKNLSIPPKTAPVKRLSPIHPSKLRRGENGKMTPTKHHFLSSPRCPPSSHHKPRASSPLRKPAISPIVTIQRPQKRQPLGEIQLTYHNPGSGTRILSRDFKFYEDPLEGKGKGKGKGMMDVIPWKRSNNKENIPPFTEKESLHGEEFIRPLPREALAKLSGRTEEVIITEEKIVNEEIITTEYFAGARILTETETTTISTPRSRPHNPEDQKRSLKPMEQTNFPPAKQLNSKSLDKSDFEIYHDDPEDLELGDYNTGIDNLMLEDEEEEEDKENADPGVFGSARGDEDWQGENQPTSHKRKLVEDWS